MAEPARIALPGGLVALVDAEDAVRVNAFAWHACAKKSDPSKHYVQRTIRITPGRAGRKGSISLHRFVMGCEPGDGKLVDHRNGDPLDNQRDNLRVTDPRGNSTNVTSSKRQKAGGYKGVHWNPRAKKWQVSICAGAVKPNGKRRQLYLGCFVDPEEAARAYDAAAIKHFGEFANLNFGLPPLAPPVAENQHDAKAGAA